MNNLKDSDRARKGLTTHDSALIRRMSFKLDVTITVSRCTFNVGSYPREVAIIGIM